MEQSDFTFFHTLRVRWAEVDRQNVVFNAHYFTYFDVANTEYWRAIGVDYPEGYVEKYGTDIFAVKATAEYHAPATYDDVLEIGARVGRLGRSSLRFVLGIFRRGERITSGELIYVNADVRTRKSAPWPDALRAAVVRFEKLPPEEDR